ncbi:MAG: hypothetical protein AAGD22_06525 [Verrucomicrobiota bacterium]
MSKRDHGVLVIRSVLVILFVLALYVSARSGVVLAKKHLPLKSVEARYPIGERLEVSFSEDAPLVAAFSPKVIRDYFFSADAGTLEEGAEQREGIWHMTGRLELEFVGEDIDLGEVRLLNGRKAGEVMWVHLRQLPPQDAGNGELEK